MPNWVTNKVTITGKKEILSKIKEEVKSTKKLPDETIEHSFFDFNKIVPMPIELRNTTSPNYPPREELKYRDPEEYKRELKRYNKQLKMKEKYGYDNWYDWSCANWGSKWNSCRESEIEYNRGEVLEYEFNTAWSMPEQIFAALSKKYP
jgi:hypothetical protein